MQRIVLTGGPSVGKTSLIERLSQEHHIFKEVARVVIKEQLELGTNKVPWDDVTGFSSLVLERQAKDHALAQNGLNFYDRGIPDIIGYMNYGDQELFPELTLAAKNLRYDHVFILPPWEDIYHTDNERRESFEESIDLYYQIKDAYLNLGYNPIKIPKASIEERVNFILGNII